MSLTPDLPSAHERIRKQQQRRAVQEVFERLARRFPHLRNRRKPRGEGMPVNPNKPSHLTGGAAAALDFEDE